MNDKIKKTNWQPTDNRFITFLDIMGFKDLVMRNSHEFIYDLLSEISAVRSAIEDTNDTLEDYYVDAEIYSVSFSDSIILFSKTDSAPCFDLITFASRFLFAKAIEKNIPLKGAMAHGELSVNKTKQIYFGQPLIDAFQLEEELKYYGVTCHHTFNNYLEENKDSILTKNNFFKCLTPLKAGNITHTNLEWFRDLTRENGPNEKMDYEKVFYDKMNVFRTMTSGSPGKYIDNTINVFIESSTNPNSGE